MGNNWSLQEDNFLRLNYKQPGLDRILGRSSDDIAKRIKQLNLGKTYKGIGKEGFQVGKGSTGSSVQGSYKCSKSSRSKSKSSKHYPPKGTAFKWDSTSDAYLRRYFPVKPVPDLVNHFGLTDRQIRHRANYLGLLRAETLGFKPIDLNYILENYATKSLDELSTLTGYHQAHIKNALTLLQIH